jgi:ubiquinone/menaquinone biosynthesis C-methylase UbiE
MVDINSSKFWDFSPLGKYQAEHNFFVKDYEELLFNEMKSKMTGCEEINLLLVGCGAGREIPKILEIVKPQKLVAIDLSSELLTLAKDRFNKIKLSFRNVDVSFILIDFLKIDNLNEYNVIYFSNNVLAYILSNSNRIDLFIDKLKSLSTGKSIIFEVPLIYRWGIMKNIYAVLIFFQNFVKYKLWGLMECRSGDYKCIYKNFSKKEILHLFYCCNFRNYLYLNDKKSYRNIKVQDNTIFGIFLN